MNQGDLTFIEVNSAPSLETDIQHSPSRHKVSDSITLENTNSTKPNYLQHQAFGRNTPVHSLCSWNEGLSLDRRHLRTQILHKQSSKLVHHSQTDTLKRTWTAGSAAYLYTVTWTHGSLPRWESPRQRSKDTVICTLDVGWIVSYSNRNFLDW
jgi:hypothetical protein